MAVSAVGVADGVSGVEAEPDDVPLAVVVLADGVGVGVTDVTVGLGVLLGFLVLVA